MTLLPIQEDFKPKKKGPMKVGHILIVKHDGSKNELYAVDFRKDYHGKKRTKK